MAYAHAERNLIATERAIADAIELLRALPNVNEERIQFMQDFAPTESLSGVGTAQSQVDAHE